MSCVVSVAGICASDDGLKISPSQIGQTPPNDKHAEHKASCLFLKSLIRFSAAESGLESHRQAPVFQIMLEIENLQFLKVEKRCC